VGVDRVESAVKARLRFAKESTLPTTELIAVGQVDLAWDDRFSRQTDIPKHGLLRTGTA
jgi:hypothetical protein